MQMVEAQYEHVTLTLHADIARVPSAQIQKSTPLCAFSSFTQTATCLLEQQHGDSFVSSTVRPTLEFFMMATLPAADAASDEAVLRLDLTARIVAAYVGNNAVHRDELTPLLATVHRAVSELGQESPAVEPERPKPAVPIRRSVTPDYLICLEDGKKLKMLKRYLQSRHGLSAAEYRQRWGLPADYPMVAPAYSQARSRMAKALGLGRGGKTPDAESASLPPAKRPRRSRKADPSAP
ncbi:MucR family transcriptional regulator [Marinivivus vitaminiproducens]|uniref:MucR family transcriptional regulator n=1 Tax=Marinivivus vitaminiproducens TaxID=3035935 RepID=UPI0027AA167B|nr:MucR family transcriptional regulator [Geminicoccaceae bacterium SCSIO 64248]